MGKLGKLLFWITAGMVLLVLSLVFIQVSRGEETRPSKEVLPLELMKTLHLSRDVIVPCENGAFVYDHDYATSEGDHLITLVGRYLPLAPDPHQTVLGVIEYEPAPVNSVRYFYLRRSGGWERVDGIPLQEKLLDACFYLTLEYSV